MKIVSKSLTDNKLPVVHVMTCHLLCAKPFKEPTMNDPDDLHISMAQCKTAVSPQCVSNWDTAVLH